MKGLLLAACCCVLIAVAATAVKAEQGPYEDIQGLLASAAGAADGLSVLDTRGAPRVITVEHNHEHIVPYDMPRHIAQRIAEDNTPAPAPVRIVAMPNLEQAARHAAEDAQYARDVAQPTVQIIDSRTTVNGMRAPGPPPSRSTASLGPKKFTMKGQRGIDAATAVPGTTNMHFPLVDRRLQRPTFPVIAALDGQSSASTFKPHTAAELQAEAAKLLSKAKLIQSKRKERDNAAAKLKAENAKLGIFNSKDDDYEDEITKLKRVSARMNRLQEQIETPHRSDTFEASIARKKYFLKIYWQLKREITQIVESYALRTGNSIFSTFGDGKIDPSIAAFLPPNSVAGILAKYTNPTEGREDETRRDVISGREAKRIQYSIDYYQAKQGGNKLPMPPKMAPTDEEIEEKAKHNNPLFNKVVATQDGEFGQNRPAVTMGPRSIGRSSVHITNVNPTATQAIRGVPVQVNLKVKRKLSR